MTTDWRKSTYSGDNASCIKIRFDGPRVFLADTKTTHLADPEPVLQMPGSGWNDTLLHLLKVR
jgi:Domain of unknown function (DUF397)